jgi:hypothetical protein
LCWLPPHGEVLLANYQMKLWGKGIMDEQSLFSCCCSLLFALAFQLLHLCYSTNRRIQC